MAADTIFETGKIKEIFFDRGTFANDVAKKYVKAPFDLLQLDGEQYILPASIPFGSGNGPGNPLGVLAIDDVEELYQSREGFYHTLEIQRAALYQFGDWKGEDNWKGLFKLGMI
jgi:hypothetical protein